MTVVQAKTKTSKMIESYLNSQSYQEEFRAVMCGMLDKFGEEIFNLSGIGEQLDINQAMKKMANASSVANGSIDSNANAGGTTAVTIASEFAKPHALIQSYYRLWKWLKKNRGLDIANEFVEAQLSGKIYVNDMHYISYPAPYCYNHSCLTIAQKGLIGLDTKNDTKPPKYLRSYFDIMEAYLLVAGNSTAGATGIANLIVVSTIFLKKMIDSGFVDSHVHLNSEEDCWQYYKEELTSFIYRLNQACRGGSQSLFTNVSIFDKHFLENIIPNTFVMIDDNVYMTDFETVKRAQEVYIDIMLEEAKRVVHTFPVTTACFSTKLNEETGKYDIQDKEFLDFICEKNEATGFINLYGGDTSILSSCCRLRSDTSNQFFNSFGGASDQIGSMGVVAINLPQLAFRFIKDEEGFETELADLVTLAQEVNYAKRCLLQSSIKKGHLPLYSNGYMDLGKQFSTVGFIGLYEACEIMGYDNTSDEGVKFGLHILDVINTINDEIAHKYKIPVNLEGIPGENTCVKLAVKDKVLGFNNQYKMYSNQFIPLSKRCNIFDRVKLSGAYDSQCSGGSIMHITIDSKVSKETMKDFVISTLGAGVKYFAFNYKINQCKDCSHIFVGEHEICPECGSKELEKFTRVVGFLTKISQWSQTRQEEDRQGYTL